MTVELLSPAQIAVHSGHDGVIYQDKDTGVPHYWDKRRKVVAPISEEIVLTTEDVASPATDLDATIEVVIQGRRGQKYDISDTDNGDWKPLIDNLVANEVPASGRAHVFFNGGDYNFGSLFTPNKERITFELDPRARIIKNWWNAGAETNALIRLAGASSNGFKLMGGGSLVGTFDYTTYGNASSLTSGAVQGTLLNSEFLLRLDASGAFVLDDVTIEDVLFEACANKAVHASMGVDGQRIKSLKLLRARFRDCVRPIDITTGDLPEGVGIDHVRILGCDIRRTWNPTAEPYNWGSDASKGGNALTLTGASFDDVVIDGLFTDEIGRMSVETFNDAPEAQGIPEARIKRNKRGFTVSNSKLTGRYRTLSLIHDASVRVVDNTFIERGSYIELFGRAVNFSRNRVISGGIHLNGNGGNNRHKLDSVHLGANAVRIRDNEFCNPPPFQSAISIEGAPHPIIEGNTIFFDDGQSNSQATRDAELLPTRRENSGSNSNLSLLPPLRVRNCMFGVVRNNRLVYRAGGFRLPTAQQFDIFDNYETVVEAPIIQTEHSIEQRWRFFTATGATSSAGDSGTGNTLRVRPGETVSNGTLTGVVMYATKRTDNGAGNMNMWVLMSSTSDFAIGNTLTGQTSGATVSVATTPSGGMQSSLAEINGFRCKFIGWRNVFESKLGTYVNAGTGTVRINCTATLAQLVYNSASNPRYTSTSVTSVLHDPPGVPSVGPIYLIGETPTGAWVGHAGELATWGGASWTYTTIKGVVWRNANQDQLGSAVGTTPAIAYSNPHDLPRPWNAAGAGVWNSWTGTTAPTNGDTYLSVTSGSVFNQFIDCDFDVCQAEPLWSNGVGTVDGADSSVVAYYSNTAPGGLIWGDRWEKCAQVPTRLGFSSTKILAKYSVKQKTAVPKIVPYAASIRLDMNEAAHFVFMMDGNIALTAPRGHTRGQSFILEFQQGGAGGNTLTASGGWTAAGAYSAGATAWLRNIPTFTGTSAGQRILLNCQWLHDMDVAVVMSATAWI